MSNSYSITLTAYENVKKVVGKNTSTSGNVYVPKEWVGKEVMVVLLEELDNKKE